MFLHSSFWRINPGNTIWSLLVSRVFQILTGARVWQLIEDANLVFLLKDIHKLIRYMLTPSADERPDIFQVISQKKIARISLKYSKTRLLVWHSSWGEPRSVLFKIFTNFRFFISPFYPHPRPESSSSLPLYISSSSVSSSSTWLHQYHTSTIITTIDIIIITIIISHQVPSFSSLPSTSPSSGAALEPPKPRAALPATPVKVITSCLGFKILSRF